MSLRESRLSRWSRVKRQRAKGEQVEEPVQPVATEAEPAAAGGKRSKAAPLPGRGMRPYMPPLADKVEEIPENALIPGDRPDYLPVPEGETRIDEALERDLTPEEQEAIKDLPPIDELDENSDFSGFLKQNVPLFIQRQALQKLWRSHPIFAVLDGLNDYDEDFTIAAQMGKAITDYKVGKGFITEEDEAKERGEKPEGDGEGDGETGAEDAAETAASGDGEPQTGANAEDAEPARLAQGVTGSHVRPPEMTPFEAQRLAFADVAESAGDDADVGDGEDDL